MDNRLSTTQEDFPVSKCGTFNPVSPLSIFPGPILAKITNITNLWRVAQVLGGRFDSKNVEIHRQYGSVARIGPNCLSVSDPSLIKSIYSTRGAWMKVSEDLTQRYNVLANR